jgi:hypothetical protein
MLGTAAAVVGNFYDLPKELVCLSLARAYQPHRRSRRDLSSPTRASSIGSVAMKRLCPAVSGKILPT